eukprot:gene5561-7683_t
MENPSDWRSAVDQSTGRTYWYHRKTRISTWVKPDFGEFNDGIDNEQKPQNDQPNIISNNGKAVDTTDYIKIYNSNLTNKNNNIFSEPQNGNYTHQHAPTNSDNQYGSILNAIKRIESSSSPTDLLQVLIHLTPTAVKKAVEESNLILLLCNIIIQTQQVDSRIIALQVLWTLSLFPHHTSNSFHINQSWQLLINSYSSKWEDGESIIILSAMLCNFLYNSTNNLLSESDKDIMCQLLDNIANDESELTIDFDTLIFSNRTKSTPNVDSLLGLSVTDSRILDKLFIMSNKGHALPTYLLIAIISQSFRNEKQAVQMIKKDSISILQNICCNDRLPKSIKGRARSCLLIALSSSSFVRERLIDSLIETNSILLHFPKSYGIDSILSDPLFEPSKATVAGTATSTYVAWEDDAENENDIMTAEDEMYFEIDEIPHVDQNYDDQLQLLENQRDVEWIPRNGPKWKLPSLLLWSRCPSLRDLISGFWDEGGGELELSIDSSSQVLSCICRYIYSGILHTPNRLKHQLELIRVSAELGMITLSNQAIEIIQIRLSNENVSKILSFSEEFAIVDLARACQSFISSGGKKTTANIRFAVTSENPHNSILRDAIYASLQDVTKVLKQPTTFQLNKLSNNSNTTTSTTNNNKGKTIISHESDNENSSIIESFSNNNSNQVPRVTADLSILAMSNPLAANSNNNNNIHDPSLYSSSQYEDYTDSNNIYKMNKGYYNNDDEPYEVEDQLAYYARGTSNGNNNSKSKPKSGGIYGLLLKTQNPIELSSSSTGTSINNKPKPSKIPGKIMSDSKAVGSMGVPKSKSNGPVTPNNRRQSNNSNNKNNTVTPNTKRATNILASARPSSIMNHNDYDDYGNNNQYNSVDFEIDEREFTSDHNDFIDTKAMEFNHQMSLQPYGSEQES